MPDPVAPAAPVVAAPVPTSNPGGPIPVAAPVAPVKQMSTTATNAASAASTANQAAAALGENTADPTAAATGAPPVDPAAVVPPVDSGPASLTPTAVYTPSGNKTIDQVAQLLINSKFEGAQTIVNEVIQQQELSLASKATLVDELGIDIANLVISQLETSVAAVKADGAKEGARLKQIAMERFGGDDAEAVWEGLQRFAQSPQANLSQDDRKVMNRLLSEGGTAAEMVINSLADKYEKSTGYKNSPSLMSGTTSQPTGAATLTKKEYQREIGPAIAKYGESSREVTALRNRRALSISKGM